MIRSIIGVSLRFWMLLIAIAVGVMAVGIVQLRNAPVDVLPEFTPPYVEVQTEALGLSANEVEQMITVPLEADLLNGIEGVDVIRSESVSGLSDIVMVFEPGTDIYQARQLVQERLTGATGAAGLAQAYSKPPTMINPLSSASRVMMIGIDPNKLSPIEAGVLSQWVIRPRLMGVPGVSNVSIWGLRDQQLQVQVDPEQLQAQGVTLNQVVETTGNAQLVSPLTFLEASTPGTGGFIESPNQRLQVRHVFENFGTPEALGNVTVEDTGGQLRVDDVANVVEEHQPLIGDAIVDGNEGRLLLVVEKFPGADTVEVTSGVEDALGKLRPGLSGMKFDTDVFQPATYIQDAIDDLRLAFIIAGVLLVLVLAAFLFSWRTTLISLVTIPLSLVAAALVLYLRGETFNPIAFAGLAVAIPFVIDDAVVGVHNVARRLSEHRQAADDLSTADVVLEALAEVRRPTTYAAFITLLAIVPVVVMEGRPGAFFGPLALSYALAVAAATLVALTVTPALSLLLFSRGAPGAGESPLIPRIGRRYDGALTAFIGRPRIAWLAAGACVVVGLALLPLLGTSLVPSFKDRDVLVRLDGAPGTSNPRMTRIATELSRELRAVPGVANVGAHVGRAVTGDQVVDVNSSELWVSIGSGADYDATLAAVEDVVRRARGVDREVVNYTTLKIRDVGALNEGDNPVRSDGLDVLTGSDKPLVARVYGQDLGVLRREAERVRQAMSGVDGVVAPRVRQPAEQPTLQIEVDLDKARRQGIKPGDVRRAEATLLQGIQVGSVFEDQKVFDVIVQGVPETRASVANVRNLLLERPEGGYVRLRQVADVRIAPTPTVIQRDAVTRRIDVEAGVSGRSVGAVASDVEARLADVKFPLEYHVAVLQHTTAEEIGTTRMLAFAIACAVAMLLLLQAAFRSWRLAALVFLTLPVALVGGVLAALIAGAELSLGSLIGLLALFTIAARHGVLLIRHLQDIRRGGEAFGSWHVRRGARERLAPLLTTASAVALIALPFVVLGTRPGLEVVHPMAVVVLGGLVTALFLSLFVLPALYLQIGAGDRPWLARHEPLEPQPVAGNGAPTQPVADKGAVP
jgi:CzcA family heavy metal efflux pump